MFINLTSTTGGRVLLNVENVSAIVEHEGSVYVVPKVGEPAIVRESYDEIMSRIDDSKGKIW